MKLKKLCKTIIITLLASLIATLCLFYGILSYRVNSVSGYIENYSKLYGVEKSLIISVIYTESKFNKNAKSSKGAIGLMQVKPATATFILNSDTPITESFLFDSENNIKVGVLYLKYLTKKYGDLITVIACYNAGEGNVIKWLKNGKITVKSIPFKETNNYVRLVLRRKKFIDDYM